MKKKKEKKQNEELVESTNEQVVEAKGTETDSSESGEDNYMKEGPKGPSGPTGDPAGEPEEKKPEEDPEAGKEIKSWEPVEALKSVDMVINGTEFKAKVTAVKGNKAYIESDDGSVFLTVKQ